MSGGGVWEKGNGFSHTTHTALFTFHPLFQVKHVLSTSRSNSSNKSRVSSISNATDIVLDIFRPKKSSCLL